MGRHATNFPTTRIARFMRDHFVLYDAAGKRMTNREIVRLFEGISSPNVISMWKTGTCKVPVERLPDIANLLARYGTPVDIAELVQMYLEQELPPTHDILKSVRFTPA